MTVTSSLQAPGPTGSGGKRRRISWRVIFLVLGGLSLLMGMNAGLLNLGS